MPCGDLKNGNIKNPYYRSVYGKGYLGVGKYKATNKGKVNKDYAVWHSMIERCYNEECQIKHPSYVGCSVDESWLCFQVFAEWYEENNPKLKGIKLELDKDFMVAGNKIYSPSTCKIIPKYANLFLVNGVKNRENNYTGIYWNKNMNKYQVQINDTISHKIVYLGCFASKDEAGKVYKLERRDQCINMYHKLVEDGFTDVEVLNKFKSGDL